MWLESLHAPPGEPPEQVNVELSDGALQKRVGSACNDAVLRFGAVPLCLVIPAGDASAVFLNYEDELRRLPAAPRDGISEDLSTFLRGLAAFLGVARVDVRRSSR